MFYVFVNDLFQDFIVNDCGSGCDVFEVVDTLFLCVESHALDVVVEVFMFLTNDVALLLFFGCFCLSSRVFMDCGVVETLFL